MLGLRHWHHSRPTQNLHYTIWQEPRKLDLLSRVTPLKVTNKANMFKYFLYSAYSQMCNKKVPASVSRQQKHIFCIYLWCKHCLSLGNFGSKRRQISSTWICGFFMVLPKSSPSDQSIGSKQGSTYFIAAFSPISPYVYIYIYISIHYHC